MEAANPYVMFMLGKASPNTIAPRKAKKIPICAAAPSRMLFGLAISGPKSVMAPTPMKIRDGKIPFKL